AKGETIVPAEWKSRPGISEEGVFLSNSRNLNFDRGGEPSRFVDVAGKIIFEQPIGVEIRFQEGLAAVWKDLQHLGFIDRTGTFVIGPFKFTDSHRVNRWSSTWNYRFSEGLAPFPDPKGGSLLGYLDKKGQMAIAPKWQQAGPFSEGLALVCEDRFLGDNSDKPANWVIIDRTGAVVGTPEVPLHRRPSGLNPSLVYPILETGFKNGRLGVLGADGNRYFLDRRGKVLGKLNRPGKDVRILHEYEEQGLFWVEPTPEDLEWQGFRPYQEVMQLMDAEGSVAVPPGCVKNAVGKPDLQSLFPRYAARKLGAVDRTGKVIVPAQWEGLKVSGDAGGLIAARKGKDIRYLDRDGKPSSNKPSPARWQDAEGWKADYDKTAQKWGFKDASGKFVLGPEWESLQMAYGTIFNDGLAGAKKDGRWGFIDRKGQVVIPFEYDLVGEFSEGLAGVRKDGKCGFVDTAGKLAVPMEWDGVVKFRNGVAEVTLGGKQEGGSMRAKGGKWGLVGKTGRVVVPAEWNDARGASRNRAWVSKGGMKDEPGGRYALMDTTTGKPLTDFVWRNVGDFGEEGLARVEKEGLCGYVNEQGQVVIEPQFDHASMFTHGTAIAWADKSDPEADSGFINTKGEWIFKTRPGARLVEPLDYTTWFNCGLAVIEDTGPWGYVRINSGAAAGLPTSAVEDAPPKPPEEKAEAKRATGPDVFSCRVGSGEAQIRRFGDGSKGVVFFSHSGDLQQTIRKEFRPHYRELLREGYSIFVWSYPKDRPFDKVPEVLRDGRGSIRFTGIASAVVKAVRENSGLENLCLVGNSLGAGVISWDYKELNADPKLRFLLLSPTPLFMAPLTQLGDMPRTVLIAKDQDPFVTAAVDREFYTKHRHERSATLPQQGHLIIGDSLSHEDTVKLIRLAMTGTEKPAAAK
ncbi:MAG: WG repeat-containing protein, partial [Verrucomicrobiaceae bacterium]